MQGTDHKPQNTHPTTLENEHVLHPEQIAGANKAGVEAVLGFAGSQFAAFERLSALNFNAARCFEEGLGRTKALLSAKDAQEYLNLNTAASQPALEKAIAYSRSVYEVAAQAQGELVKFLEARAAEFNRTSSASRQGFEECPGRFRRRRSGSQVRHRRSQHRLRQLQQGREAGH